MFQQLSLITASRISVTTNSENSSTAHLLYTGLQSTQACRRAYHHWHRCNDQIDRFLTRNTSCIAVHSSFYRIQHDIHILSLQIDHCILSFATVNPEQFLLDVYLYRSALALLKGENNWFNNQGRYLFS
jgi:hypothetical protein